MPFLAELADMDFLYDSSTFPASVGRFTNQIIGDKAAIVRFQTAGRPSLVEIPMSVLHYRRWSFATTGGGYLRMLPIQAIVKSIKQLETNRGSCMFYLHPYEFDRSRISIQQSRDGANQFSLSKRLRFNAQWNLNRKSILPKLDKIFALNRGKFITCREHALRVLEQSSAPVYQLNFA